MKTYQPIPSPLKWHGGKGGFHGKLAKWIISLMPKHVHYVEPFFGGGSVNEQGAKRCGTASTAKRN